MTEPITRAQMSVRTLNSYLNQTDLSGRDRTVVADEFGKLGAALKEAGFLGSEPQVPSIDITVIDPSDVEHL